MTAAEPGSDGAQSLGVGSRLARAAAARLHLLARRAAQLAPQLVAGTVFLALLAHATFLIDDGFIAFRHARNWAELGAPVFNTGVVPPVEGYSDFLWVALLALAHAAGLPIPATALTLGAMAGLATLFVFVHHARRNERFTGAPLVLATLLVATAPAFVVWASGGLETALFTLLVLATYTVLVGGRREVLCGLVGGVLALSVALVRVEGFLWVLVLLAAVAVARGPRGKRFPVAFGVYLAGFVVFLLWRHALYGEWLANTATAKVGLSAERIARGAKSLASYGLVCVAPVVALAAVPFVLGRVAGAAPPTAFGGASTARSATLAALLVVAAFGGYNVLVGGDWMPFWRFLAPATPFVALLVARGLALAPRRACAFAGAALVALQTLPLFDASLAPRAWLEALSYRGFRGAWQSEWQRLVTARENGAQFEQLGRALAAVTTPDDSLVFGALGAVGWHAPSLFLHDRNGLVDREVAALGGVLGTGLDAAGHDRRVPRAWFLTRTEPRRPTLFHAALVLAPPTGPITGPTSPGFVEAVRSAMSGQVLAQPGEEPLLQHTVVEVAALPDAAGAPPGSALLLWRRASDTATAERFWAAIGVARVGASNGR
jgi:hypothetical protein